MELAGHILADDVINTAHAIGQLPYLSKTQKAKGGLNSQSQTSIPRMPS
jgi:hypothetical protein